MQRRFLIPIALLGLAAAGQQPPPAPQTVPPPAKKTGPAPPNQTAPAPAKKPAPPAAAALTNRDVIRLVQAKMSDDLVISKIRTSKTNFDTSVDGLLALKQAGVSDRLLSVIMNP